MRKDIYETTDNLYTICRDYIEGCEKRIKRIVSSMEELLDEEQNVEEYANTVVDELFFKHEETRKNLGEKVDACLKKGATYLETEKEHLAMSLFDDFSDKDEQKQINSLNRYISWNSEMIREIHCIVKECAAHVNVLEKNYSKRLNNYWLNIVKKEIKEMVEFMNKFYNNDQKRIEEIKDFARRVNSSKR